MMSHAGARRETAPRAASSGRPDATAGPGACARTRRRGHRADAGPPAAGPRPWSRGGRDLDLAVDDLLTEAVDVALDVVDEPAGGGQADALAWTGR